MRMHLSGVGDAAVADCVVGGVDANGDTIASCGYQPGMQLTTGQMIANAPTCMPGDALSFRDGNWVCVPGAADTVFGFPTKTVLMVVGIAAVVALVAAGKRR